MSEAEETVERVAKAIARSIPVDAGSRWNLGYGEKFPQEYSAAEQMLIRGIARTAIAALPKPLDTEKTG